MTFDTALRLTEVLMSLAFIQQSAEHCIAPTDERRLFVPRLLLALALLIGVAPGLIEGLLLALSLLILRRFDGPYNGGSDRMSLLLLTSVLAARTLPGTYWREVALGYLALQLTLSYFSAGWVKLVNPDWRNGRALADVFAFSVYPVSTSLRAWAAHPRLLALASWAVILLELGFPLTLVAPEALRVALVLTAAFHGANALLFGLNRFVWIWLAAYPSLLWLQTRLAMLFH